MKTISLTIDGKKIETREGEKILWAALDNDIYIPNLCALRDNSEPFEVESKEQPVTACTEVVEEGTVVNTREVKALRLARSAFELLMASYPVDCAHCVKIGHCELQKIAHHLGVKLKSKRFRKLKKKLPVDSSSSVFFYDPNKCVLCGRCVWICRERLGIGALGFARRGFRRVVTTFDDKSLAESKCQDCGECVIACPAGALVFKEHQGIVKSDQREAAVP